MRSRLKRDRRAMKRARYNKRCEQLVGGFEYHVWTWGLGRAHGWLFRRKVHATSDYMRWDRQTFQVWKMFYNN